MYVVREDSSSTRTRRPGTFFNDWFLLLVGRVSVAFPSKISAFKTLWLRFITFDMPFLDCI